MMKNVKTFNTIVHTNLLRDVITHNVVSQAFTRVFLGEHVYFSDGRHPHKAASDQIIIVTVRLLYSELQLTAPFTARQWLLSSGGSQRR